MRRRKNIFARSYIALIYWGLHQNMCMFSLTNLLIFWKFCWRFHLLAEDSCSVARGIVFSSLTIFWASNVYAESYILRLWQTAIKILEYCCGHLLKVAVFGNPWLWLIFVDSCHRLSIENHFENHSANHIRDGWSGSKQTWHTQFRIRELWLDSVFVNCKVYSLITIYVKRFFPPCSWRIYLKILINKYCVEKNGCTVCLCISLFGSGSVISEWSDPIRLRSRNSPGTHKTPRGDKNFLGLKNTFSFQFCINC